MQNENTTQKMCQNLADGVHTVGFKKCVELLGIEQKDLRELLVKNNWIYTKNKLFPVTEAVIDGYVKNIHTEKAIWKADIQIMTYKKIILFGITRKGFEVLLKQVSKLMGNVQNNTASVQTVRVLVGKQKKEVGYAEAKQSSCAKNVTAMRQTAMV